MHLARTNMIVKKMINFNENKHLKISFLTSNKSSFYKYNLITYLTGNIIDNENTLLAALTFKSPSYLLTTS